MSVKVGLVTRSGGDAAGGEEALGKDRLAGTERAGEPDHAALFETARRGFTQGVGVVRRAAKV